MNIEAYMRCKGCGDRLPVDLETALKASVHPDRYEVVCHGCAKSLAEAESNARIKTMLLGVIR